MANPALKHLARGSREMGWEIIVKPLSVDASPLVISKGLCDCSTSCSVSYPTATCGSYLSVTSSPMTNRFPIGLALKEKKNRHHPRKVPVLFLLLEVE